VSVVKIGYLVAYEQMLIWYYFKFSIDFYSSQYFHFRFCLAGLFSGDRSRLFRDKEKPLMIAGARFYYRPDALLVWYSMVWYGIVEFNVPLDTV